MELRVHHIGYAVNNIDKAIKRFESLGYKLCSDICSDSIRNVKICFMESSHTRVELVAPNGDNNPIEGVLKKNGSGPYHICYEVESIDDVVTELKKSGYLLVKDSEVAPAINNYNVAFLYNASVGMIELVEVKEK